VKVVKLATSIKEIFTETQRKQLKEWREIIVRPRMRKRRGESTNQDSEAKSNPPAAKRQRKGLPLISDFVYLSLNATESEPGKVSVWTKASRDRIQVINVYPFLITLSCFC
jgi:hypothetical protein